MSRSFFYTLALTLALAAGASAANAAGYDGGWQEQVAYRSSSTASYDDTSYSAPRVIHRARSRLHEVRGTRSAGASRSIPAIKRSAGLKSPRTF